MAKPDIRTMGDYRRHVDEEEVNYGFQLATSRNFEINIFFISKRRDIPFHDIAPIDAYTHLSKFKNICSFYNLMDITESNKRLSLFLITMTWKTLD